MCKEYYDVHSIIYVAINSLLYKDTTNMILNAVAQ